PLHPVVRSSQRVRVELASEAPQPVQRRRLVGSRLAIGQRLGEFLGHGGAVVLQEGLAAPQGVGASLAMLGDLRAGDSLPPELGPVQEVVVQLHVPQPVVHRGQLLADRLGELVALRVAGLQHTAVGRPHCAVKSRRGHFSSEWIDGKERQSKLAFPLQNLAAVSVEPACSKAGCSPDSADAVDFGSGTEAVRVHGLIAQREANTEGHLATLEEKVTFHRAIKAGHLSMTKELARLRRGQPSATPASPVGAVSQAPCQLEARSVSETTVELDCRSSQPPTSAPALQQQPSFGGGRRLSLEFRRVDVGGGVDEKQAAWGTLLESVAQLPLQLDGLAPFTSQLPGPSGRLERITESVAGHRRTRQLHNPGTKGAAVDAAAVPDSLVGSGIRSNAPGVLETAEHPELPPDGFHADDAAAARGESTGEPPGLTHSEFVRQAPALVEAPACHGRWLEHRRLSPVNQLGCRQSTWGRPRQLVLTLFSGPRRRPRPAAAAAFAVDARQQLLFSVDHLGSLTRRNLTTARSESDDSIKLPRVRQKVLKLTVDWVAQHVYILTKPGDILLASDWYSKVAAEEPKKIGDSPGSRDRLRAGQVQMQVTPSMVPVSLQDGNLYRSDLPRGGLQLNWTRVPAASEASAPLSSFRVLPASQRLLLVMESNSSSVLSSDLSGRGRHFGLDSRWSVGIPADYSAASTSGWPAGVDGRLDGQKFLLRRFLLLVGADRVRLRQRSGSIRELECVEPACQPKPAPLTAPALEVFCGIGGAFARVRLPGPQGEQSERQGCFRIPSMAYSCLDLRLTNYNPSTGAAAGCRILAPTSVSSSTCLPPTATATVSAAVFYDRPPLPPPPNGTEALWSRPVVCARQQRNPNGTGRSLRLFAMTSTAGGFKYQLERLEFNETSMAEPRAAVCPESSWHGHYPACKISIAQARDLFWGIKIFYGNLVQLKKETTGAHLRVLGSSTLVAQRSDKGTGKATSRLGVPERAVVAPRWPLWRTVERVPKPKVADEQPMVGPQSQRRNGVAVGDAAALTKAHKHVVELCQPPRSVPATRVPPRSAASACSPRRSRACPRSGVAVLARCHKQRSLGPTQNCVQVSENDHCVTLRHLLHPHRELLEEGLSLIGAGSRRRIRAEQAGVPAAKPDVDPKQPRRQGDAATALLQPRSDQRSNSSTASLIR
uniref:WD_REPEATS_REGION domain-containing protein n=1 Tax=Macrostomum lignano TaxID=282301 RepID=A0A1I8FSS5_9PLAT